MSTLLIRLWPIALILAVLLIWFLQSGKRRNMKINDMKIWIVTLALVVSLIVAGIIISFSTEKEESYVPVGQRDIDDIGLKRFDPDNPPADIP